MRIRTQEVSAIHVDMVPLIDIVTLLLMFLVTVGSACTLPQVRINLPRADQARPEQELPVNREGRISISVKSVDGVHYAFIGEGKRFDITARNANTISALSAYLLQTAEYQVKHNMCKQLGDGTYNIPIKLRIGEDVPMRAVEDVLSTVADAKLRDVHYAAQPNPPIE